MVRFLSAASLLVGLITAFSSTADTKNAAGGGFLDFNIYPYLSDVDNDPVFTFNIAASLEHGFSYFSLNNFSNQIREGELGDTVGYYSEQNLRWRIGPDSAFDLTFQSNFRSGQDNDRHRLGIRWRLQDSTALKKWLDAVHLQYSINLHALQFDDEDAYVWQMEHVFRLTFPQWSNRLYLGGFIDHTFNEDLADSLPDNPIVGEIQLGYPLLENLYGVTEYRVNQYRRSDVNNLALGIEYLMRW